jgi:chloramphenicol 3-O-phosphotransferase
VKKWEPMSVNVVGTVSEVVLNGGKHSGKSSAASSFSFPIWWFPG